MTTTEHTTSVRRTIIDRHQFDTVVKVAACCNPDAVCLPLCEPTGA